MSTFATLDSAGAADGFRHMTFPAFRGLLDFDPANPTPLAVGARVNDRPAGLALAAPTGAPGSGELLSLYVDQGYRRRGVASDLMRQILAAFAARDAAEISATYMSGQPGTAAVERIFASTGWDAPEIRMLVVRCSLDSIKAAPWLNRFTVPPGYEVLPWVEVSEAERAAIRYSHARKPWIAADLMPFDFEQGIEPTTSVALRVKGEILGWCLNHVVGDVLRYTCSFVRRDLQRLGRILLLYNEAVARMPAAGMSVGMWTVPVWHAGMVNFARRHMEPYSIFFGETRGVKRRLAQSAEAPS